MVRLSSEVNLCPFIECIDCPGGTYGEKSREWPIGENRTWEKGEKTQKNSRDKKDSLLFLESAI